MYSYTSSLTNWEAIEEYLSKGANKTNRPAPKDNGHNNNTRIVKWTEMKATIYGIKLHDTVVVRYHTNGVIILNTNGWKTVTTRDRINYYTPSDIQVWQEKHIWYLSFKGERYLFEDGMKLHFNGEVTLNDEKIKPYSPEQEKKIKKLKKQVDDYCKAFIEKFVNQKIPLPGPGDCWMCSMKSVEDGKTMGDMGDKADHILSHIKEKYYVPSLLHNAIKEDSIGMSINDKNNIAILWNNLNEKSDYRTFAMDITKRHLTTTLKRYINKRVGLGIT